jgi:hypothetical protein
MSKYDDAYDSNLDKTVRVIKEYDLVELSLVDTPANQFANILSVEKNDQGVDMIKGDLVDTVIENVFWDKDSGLVILSENEVEESPTSGAPMQNIGFVEKSDNEKTDMIKFLVDSAKGINTIEINKEVSPMTDTTNDVVLDTPAEEVAVEESTVEETQVAPEAETSEEVTDSIDVEKGEVTTVTVPLEEAMQPKEDEATKSDMSEDEVVEPVANSGDALDTAVADIKDTVTKAFSDLTAVVRAQAEQIAELQKSIASVKNEVTESKDVFNEFGKRVDAVEADTAFRKSGDLGEIVQENQPELVEKSLWGGRFLKTADLFK